ncbi:MAG: hypothetical protein SGPRY_014696, partial [Prymnesium sp.]
MRLRLEGILPTCASISFGFLFLFLFAYGVCELPSEAAAPSLFDTKRIRPVMLVTLGWNALYFCFLQGQAAAAFWVHKIRRSAAGKKEEPQSKSRIPLEFAQVKYGNERSSAGLIFTMDRTVGNM